MKQRKIGVMIESFRLGVEGGIRKAAHIGADGFQIFCTSGEMAPENMSASGRRQFRQMVADQGLIISALCADYFRGFLNPETNDETVALTIAAADLAADLATDVVTSHIGKLPEDESAPEWKIGVDALTEVAAHGEKIGVKMASETGPESGELLRRFLDKIPGNTVGANYDPANLVMLGFDQISGVAALEDCIFHTHAKDGTRDPVKEVPLGEGDVNFPRYIAALDAIGYDGFLTIEREVGDDPVTDIVNAIAYLRTL